MRNELTMRYEMVHGGGDAGGIGAGTTEMKIEITLIHS